MLSGSVRIVKQPSQYLLDPGPRIGDEADLIISCEADGWPLPTYQWYKNNVLLEGETAKQLKISLKCPENSIRTYRCIRCKMVSLSLPLNAFHIKCGNCGYQFTFKEVVIIFVFVIHFLFHCLLRLKSSTKKL